MPSFPKRGYTAPDDVKELRLILKRLVGYIKYSIFPWKSKLSNNRIHSVPIVGFDGMGEHIQEAHEIIYLDYKALQQREKWTNKSKRATLWEKAHQRNAKRVLRLIIELEGLWVKLGQYLSTRADVLPDAYIRLLRQLQDSLPPRRLEEVCRSIQKELGMSMDDLFLNFVEVPLATASIAQVHRATLRDGQEVVVKVQHEGIKTVILKDLKNAKSIVDWIAWAEPQYDFNPMIDEWCKEAPKELDFNHEAENTRTVSRNLGCRNRRNDNMPRVDVLIPEVIQYMDGIRLNDTESLQAVGVDKLKLVEEITRAYAHQIYVDGFFNGDPHPGNFLVSKEPPYTPILLDFGLTKLLSSSMKQALAKMFLASAEGDYVALLSAFAEMGLKLRLDIPEQAMEVMNVFFRTSTPPSEALENMKALAEQRTKNMKVIQEKLNLKEKEVKRFNPVDAFPGDIVIFTRVLNLLRGLSTTMDVRINYMDIMRPFADNISNGPALNAQWILNTPAHSDLDVKLRHLLVELGNADKILGIQVCAYKNGEVIIDTSAGVLGRYDPRPVQPDSLFPVFSVTKGITAGMLHWLIDHRKLKLEESVANIWPKFKTNKKDAIKVHHVLNHTSGLHNALADLTRENPLLMCDWDECLNRIALSAPETEPGHKQLYHYMSFGWLCARIWEEVSGDSRRSVESRLATLTLDMDDLSKLTLDKDDLSKLSGMTSRRNDLPSTFQPGDIAQLVTTLPAVFNTLDVRRAILPAANGHCSARALARYYASLVDGGVILPPHSSLSKPPLGSHPHTPIFASKKTPKKSKGVNIKEEFAASDNIGSSEQRQNYDNSNRESSVVKADSNNYTRLVSDSSCSNNSYPTTADKGTDDNHQTVCKIFSNPRVHDVFLGAGEYENLILPGGKFGLGFRRVCAKDGSIIGFGHSGMGGSTGYCDIRNRFAIAVTVNKMSFGAVTGRIINFVCSELDIPLPEEFSRGTDLQLNLEKPLIN
ncbi:hypothetical protein RJ639_002220 [Escallonia herrerae]|uniref:ABC1 family protein n=1 Tax=Escallonia herrerae TaxID=1293975 RepID=A0AA89BF81_9ASTE|nr:hypothetical protein RJ639_002220 [Escallonia herrerae]